MISNSVLNTVAATAGDISLANRHLNINTDYGDFPDMRYEKINNFTVTPSVIETVYNVKIGWTAADNTAYSFRITQDVNGSPESRTFTLADSGTSATNTTIGTALAAQVNGGDLNITATWTPNDAFIVIV